MRELKLTSVQTNYSNSSLQFTRSLAGSKLRESVRKEESEPPSDHAAMIPGHCNRSSRNVLTTAARFLRYPAGWAFNWQWICLCEGITVSERIVWKMWKLNIIIYFETSQPHTSSLTWFLFFIISASDFTCAAAIQWIYIYSLNYHNLLDNSVINKLTDAPDSLEALVEFTAAALAHVLLVAESN